MTGPEHYRKAEEHLQYARDAADEWHQRQAQVHATLALAAATAASSDQAMWPAGG